MPEEAVWESLFDVPLILSTFDIGQFHDVAELGCGYGTFSIPVAKAIRGTLYTFDIGPAMVARTLSAERDCVSWPKCAMSWNMDSVCKPTPCCCSTFCIAKNRSACCSTPAMPCVKGVKF